MFSLFRLIRWLNLLIIALIQILVISFLILPEMKINILLSTIDFILYVFSLLILTAAGYIINDYFDIRIDLINKPDKTIVGFQMSRRIALILHTFLNFISISIGFYLNYKIGIIFLFVSIMLWWYSALLKKKELWGNLMIAFLAGLVLLLPGIYYNNIPANLLVYTFFAFAITLLREIIKDAEDMEGDKQFNCKTFPVVKGINKTITLLKYLTLLILFFVLIAIFANKTNIFLFFYSLFLVAMPLYILYKMILDASSKKDFNRISLLCKLVILSGVFSMLLL